MKVKRNINKYKYVFRIIKYTCISIIAIHVCSCQNRLKELSWPETVKEITYISNADSTEQPALIYVPFTNDKELPLLVALHTWSGTYKQKGGSKYANWCIENSWFLIHPHFRGPNKTPKAMGSDYVVKDIVSAVEYMINNYSIDTNRIYLVGYSGGGMASLLMAGRHPEIWAGVSAWNSISDLIKWWKYSEEYARDIENAAGGKPDINETAADECIKRSPITYLENAIHVKIDINAGIDDSTVPFYQSLIAYNKIVDDRFEITLEQINKFHKTKEVPDEIKVKIIDHNYGNNYTIFRRVANNTRITIFKGGHEIIHEAALKWLKKQRKNIKPIWDSESEIP